MTRNQSNGRSRLSLLFAAGLVTVSAGCLPAVGLRGGVATANHDTSFRTAIEADLGIADARKTGILYALSTGYSEGHHDLLTVGPKVGTYFWRDASLRVDLAADTGPVLVNDGDDGWYYGLKGSVGLLAAYKDQWYYPFSLQVQMQYGKRNGVAGWNGSRTALAVMAGFVFP